MGEKDMAMHRSGARRWLGAAGAALIVAACQQGPAGNGGNEAEAEAGNQAPAGGTSAGVPPPHPVTMEPDPANQTSPVARNVDAGFPEPCQAYVRDVQACLDRLGPAPTERTREIRLQLHSDRGTWSRVQDRDGLTNICRDHRGMLREKLSRAGC
jgi:hypothetical protein